MKNREARKRHAEGKNWWRLALTMAMCAAGFAAGALDPSVRMLVGATTALLAVAVVQGVLVLVDGKKSAVPPNRETLEAKESSAPAGIS